MDLRIVVIFLALLSTAQKGGSTVAQRGTPAYDASKGSLVGDLIEEVTTMNDEIDSLRGITAEWQIRERVGELDSFVNTQLRVAASVLARARGLNNSVDPAFHMLKTQITSMVNRLETLGFILSRTIKRGESKSTTIGGIALEVDKPPAWRQGLTKTLASPFSKSDMQIPGTISLPVSSGEFDSLVFLAIRFPDNLLDTDGNETLSGDILSASIYPSYPTSEAAEVIAAGDNKIIITIERQGDHDGTPLCKFMDFAHGEFRRWSTEGCSVGAIGSDAVECHCNHLTAFTILNMATVTEQSLNFATWFGCIVTSLFCMATALAIIGYRILKSLRSYMRMGFLCMLGSSEIIFLAGIRYSDMPAICTMVAFYLQYSILGSFAWLLSYVLFLGNEVAGETPNALKVIHYSFIGWMAPLLVVLISLIWRYEDYRDDVYCWISENGYFGYAYLGPILFVAVVTLLLLLHVVRTYFREVRKDKIRAQMLAVAGSGIRSCCFLLPALAATWILAHFVIVFKTLLLQILFTVCNSILGILVFLFMFVFNEEIRQARKRVGKKGSPCACTCCFKSSDGYRRHRPIKETNVVDVGEFSGEKREIKPVIMIEDTPQKQEGKTDDVTWTKRPAKPKTIASRGIAGKNNKVPILATPEDDLTSEEYELDPKVADA